MAIINTTPMSTVLPLGSFTEHQNMVSKHLELAAKYRYSAHMNFKSGKHIEGCEDTVSAFSHLCIARAAQRRNATPNDLNY